MDHRPQYENLGYKTSGKKQKESFDGFEKN